MLRDPKALVLGLLILGSASLIFAVTLMRGTNPTQPSEATPNPAPEEEVPAQFVAYLEALTPKSYPEYTLNQLQPPRSTGEHLAYDYLHPEAERESVWQIDETVLGPDPAVEAEGYRAYRTQGPYRNYLWNRGEVIYHNTESNLAQVYYNFDADPLRYLSDIYVAGDVAWFYYQAYSNLDIEKSLEFDTLQVPYLKQHEMYQRRINLRTGQQEDRAVCLPNQAKGKAIAARFDEPNNLFIEIDFFDEQGNSTGGEGYGFHLSECLKADPTLHSRVRKDDDPNVAKYEIPFVESNSTPR